jgi:hypothetical protein
MQTKEERAAYYAKYYQEHKEEIAARSRKHYQKHKEKIAAGYQELYKITDWCVEKYGNNPCEDCGHWFPWECMDFDHRPEEVKTFGVADKGGRKATPKNIATVEKEIAKCDLVCANCHRIRTKGRKDAAK